LQQPHHPAKADVDDAEAKASQAADEAAANAAKEAASAGKKEKKKEKKAASAPGKQMFRHMRQSALQASD
jgi:hypothetical protein